MLSRIGEHKTDIMDKNQIIICKACGHENEASFTFCRKCGTCLQESEKEGETALLLATQPVKSAGKGAFKTLANVFAFLIILGFIALIIIIIPSPSRMSRGRAREKFCYANMRVILGAVEMYNMDHNDMIETLQDKDATSPEGLLVQGKYLRNPINRPEEECYYSGYDLSGSGHIVCDKHGTVEGEY